MIPTIGRIVHYRLTAQDVEAINRRRAHALAHMNEHRENANGVQIHVGNGTDEGDAYPMIITQVWGDQPDSVVNGQVFMDGNDLLWATSVGVGVGPGTWRWPTRS
jgi:hypothetical protein